MYRRSSWKKDKRGNEQPHRVSRRRMVAASGALLGAVAAIHPAISRATSAGLRFAIDEDTLVIADNLTAHWRTLDPGWFYEGNPSAAMYLVYEQLYHIPDGTKPTDVLPMLAADMPDYSDDGLTATIPLREGVRFHTTGNEMTASDVVFTFDRLKNIGYQASFLATDYWDEIEAVDDYTLRLSLPTPNAELPTILTAVMLSITDQEAVEAAGGTDAAPENEEDDSSPEIQANMAARDAIDHSSVGSGPFRVAQFDLNGEVRIERNPDYWGEPSPMNQIIWRNTLDLNAQYQSVQVGEADIATAVNAEEVAGIEEEDDLQILEGATLAIQYMAFNQREDWGGPLVNKQVRHAIAHAIDYDGIIESLLFGRALRPAVAVPLPLAGTEAVLDEALPYDLAMAQFLWDQSGVGDVTIEIMYGSDATARGGVNLNTLAAKIQSDLEKIQGLTVELAPLPNAQRRTLHRNGEYQVMIGSWIPDFPGADSYATPFYGSTGSAAKRTGYADPEMDAMLVAAVSELDDDTRDDLYADIQRKAIDDCPYVVLYQPIDIKVAAEAVEDASVHPAYSMQLRQAHKSG